MIFSLLYVGLLCMGVGAKASTPISNNRTTQKQQRQILQENTSSTSEETRQDFTTNQILTNNNATSYIDRIGGYDGITGEDDYLPITRYQKNEGVNDLGSYTNIFAQDIYLHRNPTAPSDGHQFDNGAYIDYDGNFYNRPQAINFTTQYANYPSYEVITDTRQWQNLAFYNYTDQQLTITYSIEVNTYITINKEVVNLKNADAIKIVENVGNYITNNKDYTQIAGNTYSVLFTMLPNTTKTTYGDFYQITNTKTVQLIANNENAIITTYQFKLEISDNIGQATGTFQIKGFEYYNSLNMSYFDIDGWTTLEGYYNPVSYNYEIINLPGLLWEILTMPFAFYTMAFNLTLFPGTPYSFNISNFILVILGVMIFIFLIRKFKR